MDARFAMRSALALLLLTIGPGAARDADLVRHTTDGLDKQRPAWSPDGRRLAFARHESGGTHIWQYVMGVGPAAAPRRLTARTGPDYDAVFSPDGQRLLFVIVTVSGTQGNLDIASIRVDGSGQETVARDTTGLSHQEWPSWSPDGRRFAFSSTHEKNQEIYTARVDGSDVVRVTQNPGTDTHACWSPDGQWIVFATDRWGGLELARIHPDGTGLVRLTTSPGLDDYPAVSPDGARLAFVSNRDGRYAIYVASAEGANPAKLSGQSRRETYPTWTPDGQGVTFVSQGEGGTDLYTRKIGR